MIVLTHDSDFVQIIFTGHQLNTGVIFLRPGHIKSEFHQSTIEAIAEAKLELNIPFILVAEKTTNSIKIRLRGL